MFTACSKLVFMFARPAGLGSGGLVESGECSSDSSARPEAPTKQAPAAANRPVRRQSNRGGQGDNQAQQQQDVHSDTLRHIYGPATDLLTASNPQETLVKLAKKLKKNNVAVDVVSLAAEEENTEKLEAFQVTRL